MKDRLGDKAETIEWICQNIAQPLGNTAPPIDIWVDRAVLHFLTEGDDIQGYFNNVLSKVKVGGHALFAEYPPHGAAQCAGLELQRYSVEELSERLGSGFSLIEHFDHTYISPAGDPRPYVYALFARNLTCAERFPSRWSGEALLHWISQNTMILGVAPLHPEGESGLRGRRTRLIPNANHLALKSPILRPFNQPCPHRVLVNIVPLFRIAFTVPKQVVEEAGLPMRRRLLNRGRDRSFHHPNGCSERMLRSHAQKAVDVVGHDHVLANCDTARFCLFRMPTECCVNSGIGEDGFALGGAEGHEVDGGIVALEDLGEAVRFVGAAAH